MIGDGYRLYMDGNKWCAVHPHFIDLQKSHGGFGDTQQEAVDDLKSRVGDGWDCKIEDFEVGGYCKPCRDWVEEIAVMEGCRDPVCPCQ